MAEEQTTEIDLNYDDFIADVTARNREDSERAQSAGESRQKIAEFLDETGLHPKAYSFCRMVLRQKKYAAQSDILRSMKEALPHVEAYVMGNQADMFDKAGDEPDDDAPEPVDFADPDAPEDDGGSDDEPGNVTPFGVRA